MTKIVAIQAVYVPMDQQATLAEAVDLIRQSSADGVDIALLVEQAFTVPGPVTEALGEAARESGAYIVVGSRSASRTEARSTTPRSTSARTANCSASIAS